eukprot:CAMPEP_0182420458 /NCGR_PEP_ID=MMETSP1167-20130531/5285_1 /TAXON_ID=2988 /ORGANISM="Mallomonas Sp, Strain CCMP3275" /LENGTH=316 /DNA_ID=CAMNT_0024596441 /DNA_START=97 /DNA_END=1048 /DNA_ORIENTATION=-
MLLLQVAMLIVSLTKVNGIRLCRHSPKRVQFSLSSSVDALKNKDLPDSGDLLMTGINLMQDITVKAISCKEVVQESILKNDLSPQAASALGEVMACSLMMGSGLKDGETLQVNVVGSTGLKNVMVITDGELKCRGMVGNSQISLVGEDSDRIRNLFGEGQIQVVRNHPSWKYPTNGITLLRDTRIPLNLALYMAESEQRTTVLITDVRVDGSLCRHALGIMLERLPGATEENIEKSIQNLEEVEKKGLRAYLDRTDEERKAEAEGEGPGDGSGFRSFEPVLGTMVDECLNGLESLFGSLKPLVIAVPVGWIGFGEH